MLLLAVSFVSCTKVPEMMHCDCKGEFYYRNHEGNKIYLNHLNDWLIIGFERQAKAEEIVEYVNKTGLFKKVDIAHISYPDSTRWLSEHYNTLLIVNIKQQKTCSQLKEIILMLEQSSIVEYAGNIFCGETNCSTWWATGFCFYVTVNDENDLDDLYALSQETNTLIIGQNEFDLRSFVLKANKYSTGNSLQMANFYFETGLFESTGPGLLFSKGSITGLGF